MFIKSCIDSFTQLIRSKMINLKIKHDVLLGGRRAMFVLLWLPLEIFALAEQTWTK